MNAYRAPVAGLLLAMLSSASPRALAQADLESDRALAALISRYADRRSIDLPVASEADGSMSSGWASSTSLLCCSLTSTCSP